MNRTTPGNLFFVKTLSTMANQEQISDSLLFDRRYFDGERRAMEWLYTAYHAYARLSSFRQMRAECKDYSYGRQYSKSIVVNGRQMTKEAYLSEKGIPVVQTNLLGKVKRIVQGQFRMKDTAPVCNAPDPNEKQAAEGWSVLLKQNMRLNRRSEVDARLFEEFLISGLAVMKVSWGYNRGKLDAWTDYVNPNFVFFPDSLDFFLDDIRFCGMIHTWDFQDVLEKFSHSDADDLRLQEIYTYSRDKDYLSSEFARDKRIHNIEDTDFFLPAEYGKCRVIELWTRERRRAWYCDDPLAPEPYFMPYDQRQAIDDINAQRLELNVKRWPDGTPMTDADGNPMYFIAPDVYAEQNLIKPERRIEGFWYFRYLSPDGHVLEEGESPYWNGSESFHPFVFKPYPYIDGEFHPFISEIKPSQDYFNYYMIALDFYIKNAAKGVLMIDEESLSDQMSIDDIADQYVRSNGVILYTSKKGGRQPDTKQAGSIPGGFDYIIQLSRTLMEDVSGVQAALQGKQAGQSGVLYQSQVSQASSSILDLIHTFNSFLTEVAYKVLKVMRCFYRGQKMISIAGEPVPFNADTMHDVELDVSISDDMDSPVYRALSNQLLLSMAEKGQIPMRVALESGNFPNSAKILSALDKYEAQLQQMQAQQQPQNV